MTDDSAHQGVGGVPPRGRQRQGRGFFSVLCGMLLGGMVCAAHAGLDTQPDPASGTAPPQAPDNQACLRCHAMTTLAYRDPATGGIIDLSIDRAHLSLSVHGELECTECHARGYRRYPHPDSATGESLDCVGCHEDDPVDAEYHFPTIDEQFARSVHAESDKPEAAGFSCHSCHDPHGFRVSRVGKDLADIVRDGNQVCLSCHGELLDPLLASHAWLPNRDKHWEAVRCIDCHTAPEDAPTRVSHRILSAANGAVDCVSCHSSDQRLLNRLYQYRSEEDLAREGLFAKAVFNEAYVVGLSRSPLLDRLSLLIIGLTLLGLIAHGFGRYLAYRRSRGNSQ